MPKCIFSLMMEKKVIGLKFVWIWNPNVNLFLISSLLIYLWNWGYECSGVSTNIDTVLFLELAASDCSDGEIWLGFVRNKGRLLVTIGLHLFKQIVKYIGKCQVWCLIWIVVVILTPNTKLVLIWIIPAQPLYFLKSSLPTKEGKCLFLHSLGL